MKNKKLLLIISITLIALFVTVFYSNRTETNTDQAKKESPFVKKEGKKKSLEEKRRFAEERLKYEFNQQASPKTGKIPKIEKQKEAVTSNKIMAVAKNQKIASNVTYIPRGPSNFGGRTRSLVIDVSDNTSNTIIAGGVSSGVFRTTDGGASWIKVSANDEIHNATSIAQDPRPSFQNIWYYATGETIGNSADADAAYLGQGIWQSTDSGITWTQMPSTSSVQEENDSPFDKIGKIAVHPVTGDLYAATGGAIRRFDGTVWTLELDAGGNFFSDVEITTTGIVYAAFSGSSSVNNGVWQSPTGVGSYTRIGSNTTPGFGASGRMVLAIAPSNENIVYSFFVANATIPAGLWQFNDATDTWTNYSSKMPDEPGGDSPGNDPITLQGGYDVVVSVKPDNENFVIIGGTNAYKIEDITIDPTFLRIGGYLNNSGYSSYNIGGTVHHPDIHALVFDPTNANIMISGTDGGIHKTNDIGAASVAWVNLNNDYQTYQFYHVATDPNPSSNIVIGGAQDNGTVAGGFSTSTDLTTMSEVFGGDGVAVAVSNDDGCVPFFMGFQNGDIFRDCPNGGAFITPTGANSQFVTYFFLDPANNNALYYAGESDVFRTTESSAVTSATWDNIGTIGGGSDGGPNNEEITRFSTSWGAYTPNSYLLVGGNSGTILRLNDPHNAFSLVSATDITPPGATRAFPNFVSGMAVHPSNPDIVLLTYSNYGVTNIFITNNATAATPTWTIAERNLDTFSIRSAAITEDGNETRYFVGTARGLYSSTDPVNEDWSIESPDQIGFALVSSLAYKPSSNKLLVGTHGNGMYEGSISDPLSVEEFNKDDKLVAYPVPATTVVNIVIDDAFVVGDLDYDIYDLKGSLIKNGALNAKKQINVEDLSKGAYILQMSSGSKKKSIMFSKK